MITVFKHEIKINLKSLLIWSLSVGIMGMVCTLMYSSMEGQIEQMAANFAQMGAFADAFGMNTLSIATIGGFFASEVGAIHGLGSAMFAATVSILMLSKEEDAHTAEFLFTHPVKRNLVVTAKLLALMADILLFTLICGVFYIIGFLGVGADVPVNSLTIFLSLETLMNLEIMAICFFLSSVSKNNRFGAGLGTALILYLYDIIARVIPNLEDYAFVCPFSFANATEVFAHKEISGQGIIVALIVLAVSLFGAYFVFCKKDLAS